jgi:predicted DNA-binding transcriptional regulator YafY
MEESRAGITVRAAAEELGVSERTARRYLEALERSGYPIERADGRCRLLRLPGALDRLTEAERRRMVMAAIAAWPIAGTPIAPSPLELNERLFSTARQRDLFARLKMPLSAPRRLAIDYTQHEATLSTLLKAMDEKRVVDATYFSAGRNELTRRDLDPYTFYYDPTLETVYVFAYCHTRRDMRTFAVHRFRETRITRRAFQPDPAFSVEKYLAGSFRLYRGKQTAQVVLRFSPAVAGRIAERRWHASQAQKWLPDGSLELTLTVDGDEEIRPFVLSYGADVTVLSPDWLAQKIADEATTIALRNRRLGPRRSERPTESDGSIESARTKN